MSSLNYPPKTDKEQPAKSTPAISERRWFDAFVIGSIDPILVFDEKLVVKFVNHSGAELFGKSSNFLVGRSIEECEAIGSIIAPVLRQVLKLKTGISCDHEMPEEKHERIFQGSYSPVLNVKKEVLGIFSVLREVTDRRALLRQLQASNKRLQAQAKALEVFDIVSESDLSGQILYVNDKFCEQTKYSRSELIGTNYRILNSGTHSKAFFQELWETISQGHPWLGEIKNRAKDGSTFWVQTILTPIFNEDGRIARLLSIQQDITQERDERFKVAGSALRFRQILDSSSLMEVSLDLDQNITFCNKTFLQVTGYLEKKIIGKSCFETFIPHDGKSDIQANILQLFANKNKVIEFESPMIANDGVSMEIDWVATVIKNAEGNAYGIHLLGEEKGRESSVTDDFRQDVLGFVSHELKGGLISIKSGIELIQDELISDKCDLNQIQIVVSKILRKVSRVDTLTRNMMMNLEKGSRSVSIQTQPISLRTVLIGVWNRMQEELAAKFTFDLQLPETDVIVHWDPLKIEQVERNLLSNAIQYSKIEGGKITLLARQTENNILISVSDEGIGVPPESVESMFQLFTRGTNTYQEHGKHFGIGLKLCKDIVSMHRGRIWVESKLNLGTSVFLLIPIDPKNLPHVSTGT